MILARRSAAWLLALSACRTPDPWVWPASDAAASAPADASPPADGSPRVTAPEAVLVAGAGGAPFDPDNPDSGRVELDGAGALRLILPDGGGAGPVVSQSVLWVANSGEGTVSKFDTRTLTELARYDTYPGRGADPSRTTVNLDGDLVVANRSSMTPERASAVKIAGGLSSCVDRNGNGRIDTSTGKTALTWPAGQRTSPDECVLWLTDLPSGSLPRAAGWSAATGDQAEVFIGLFTNKELWRLRGRDGGVLTKISVAPSMPYGLVVDGKANVWVRGAEGSLAKVDPSRQDQVTVYRGAKAPPCAYGIAADSRGRIYTAGSNCVSRFDPATEVWEKLTVPGAQFLRGLALDQNLNLWVADSDLGLRHIDASGSPMVLKGLAVVKGGFAGGAAIDFDGTPWLIATGHSKAYRVNPGDYSLTPVATGNYPYTYSDMTGYQLRNAVGALEGGGRYVHTFTACNGGLPSQGPSPLWVNLSWSAALPPGTALRLRVRAADTLSSLPAAWTQLTAMASPSGTLPLDLPAASILQVQAVLEPSAGGQSPVLKSLSAGYACPRF